MKPMRMVAKIVNKGGLKDPEVYSPKD